MAYTLLITGLCFLTLSEIIQSGTGMMNDLYKIPGVIEY